MIDKRKHQRVDMSLSGRYKMAAVAGDLFETTVINLSPEGLCFYSGVKIENGQRIELDIQIDQERHVRLAGLVAWSDKKNESGFYCVGTKLIKTGHDDEKIFIDFYEEKKAKNAKKKKRILVVDDEKDLVSLLSFHLTQAGYEVVMAFDGEEGYQKYHNQAPDLIILDLKMPKLNGFEVCRKIRREDKDTQIPILMLTALQDDADRLIGKVVGAQRYMTKPFKIEDLLKEVEWLMPVDFFMGGE